MTEQPPTSAAPLPTPEHGISASDIERFFTANWKSNACEICLRNSTWATMAEGETMSAFGLLSSDQELGVIPKRMVVCLNVICKNCGNLKLLGVKIIKAWLQSNPSS